MGITGFKNSGKTTLVERLVREFTSRGFAVATVKHAHHAFDIDYKGRDSWRHRAAGAREVAVVSNRMWALIHELENEPEPRLADVLAKLGPCDLVLVEGYKREPYPKIEVRSLGLKHPELAARDPTVVAIAADGALADAPVPVFRRDDIAAIADFIAVKLELAAP